MNISIFSKLECKGGSEWRNYEYAKGFIQKGHDVKIYCYRHYNPLLKEKLIAEIGNGWISNLYENMRFKIDCRNDEILIITPVDEFNLMNPDWLNEHITNKQNLKKVFVIVNWGMDNSKNIASAFNCPVIYLCANTEYRDKFIDYGMKAEFIHTPISNTFFDIIPDYDNVVIGRHSRSFSYKFSPEYANLIAENPQYNFKLMGLENSYLKSILCLKNVEVLKEFSQTAQMFLKSIGILLQINQSDYFEMSPRIVAEAMAVGLPTISKKKSGAANMITHGEDGFLYESPKDILDFLKELTSSQSLRFSIGQKARQTAKRNHLVDNKILELEELMNRKEINNALST